MKKPQPSPASSREQPSNWPPKRSKTLRHETIPDSAHVLTSDAEIHLHFTGLLLYRCRKTGAHASCTHSCPSPIREKCQNLNQMLSRSSILVPMQVHNIQRVRISAIRVQRALTRCRSSLGRNPNMLGLASRGPEHTGLSPWWLFRPTVHYQVKMKQRASGSGFGVCGLADRSKNPNFQQRTSPCVYEDLVDVDPTDVSLLPRRYQDPFSWTTAKPYA